MLTVIFCNVDKQALFTVAGINETEIKQKVSFHLLWITIYNDAWPHDLYTFR